VSSLCACSLCLLWLLSSAGFACPPSISQRWPQLRAGVLSSQGTSGGHGMFGSQGGQGQGNVGGPGTPWEQGTNSLEGSVGQGGDGGPFNYRTNSQVKDTPFPPFKPHSAHTPGSSETHTQSHPPLPLQGAVAQPGYGSVRGSNQNSGVRGRVWGWSGHLGACDIKWGETTRKDRGRGEGWGP
jgi:hypothetical protein